MNELEEFEFRDRLEQEQASEQPRKSLARRIGEGVVNSDALPIAGGVIGGIAGLPAAPATMGMSSVGGAALGGAAGESYRQLAARRLGMEAPETSTEAAKRIGGKGLEQGAYEALGSYAVAPILKGVGRVLRKPAGQAFEILTKMKPQDASTLYKNPEAILPSTYEKAQGAWRSAAEKIGLPVDEVSPEMIGILKGDAKKTVFETYGRLIAGESVTAKEAQLAKQALDIAVMPEAKTIRKNPIVATLNKMRQAFSERLSRESPEMAAANREYAIATTGRRFRSLFPRNKTGDPAYFRSTVFPSLMAGLGATQDGPATGATYGAGVLLGSSPLAIGSAISGAGYARRLARPAIPLLRRAAVSGLANLTKDELEGDENVSGESGSRKPTLKTFRGVGRLHQNVNQNPENADRRDESRVGQQNPLDERFNQVSPQRVLTENKAREYLKKSNGDKAKARQKALADGWMIP
jgi:hypothetical protein